ncbi:MAG: hypothetical protein GY810_01350 [Aureispira sp.]|nr:hypothetical protein [Aureispira sp.]
MAKNNSEKINALLHSQTSENNYLAYQLLQSQLQYTSLDALDYIFQFQLEQIWSAKMGYYKFELGKYTIKFSSDEEMETDYTVDFHYLTVYIQIYRTIDQKQVLREDESVSDYIWEVQILIQEYIKEYQTCIQRILPPFSKLLQSKSYG